MRKGTLAVKRMTVVPLAMLCLACAVFAPRVDAAVEVYFLRHGETTWNRAGLLQGSIAYTDLTRKGVLMAEETARGMSAAGIRFDRIYASPYLRARHTADLIAKGMGGPAPIEDERLREMCFGWYEGKPCRKGDWPDENLRRLFEEPDGYVPHGEGAETFKKVGRRLRDFLEGEIRPLDGKVERVLCVAHSIVLRALVRELAGDNAPASAMKTLQCNCCVHVVRYEDGRFTLKETGRIFYSPETFDAMVEPRMVAHRGAGDLTMPEASLPAYSNAVAMACDIVKLDLQRTRDGVVVMGHDNTLRRNMGWDVRIADLDYAEILEKGRFLENGTPGSWRIVRLDEALAIVRPIPEMWIDFKDNNGFSPEFGEDVVAAIRRAGIDPSRVMVATFNKTALKYFQLNHPSIRRVQHFNFDVAKESRDDAIARALRLKREYGLFGFNMPVVRGQTRPENIARLKEEGLWISLWFVQKPEKAERYRPAMPDAFVTDHVSLVRRW
ncbi:MAG: histidine phosphatase family protein [Kiritimatiellae bacterium]|nr:histidine phosphatase family protein [Kiritimatiellia bacterium]